MKKKLSSASIVEESWMIRNKFFIFVHMKTLLATIVAALLITIMFCAGGYSLYCIEADPALFILVLGIAWAVSLWLLFSTVFSKKRKRSISFLRH